MSPAPDPEPPRQSRSHKSVDASPSDATTILMSYRGHRIQCPLHDANVAPRHERKDDRAGAVVARSADIGVGKVRTSGCYEKSSDPAGARSESVGTTRNGIWKMIVKQQRVRTRGKAVASALSSAAKSPPTTNTASTVPPRAAIPDPVTTRRFRKFDLRFYENMAGRWEDFHYGQLRRDGRGKQVTATAISARSCAGRRDRSMPRR